LPIGAKEFQEIMAYKGSAFVKGGCGCLALFVLLALLAVLAGGHAHANLGGLLVLFLIGGGIGLVVLAIYDKGGRDATASGDSRGTGESSNAVECSACGTMIPAGSSVCPNCGRSNTGT
jgi:hypothetical protein